MEEQKESDYMRMIKLEGLLIRNQESLEDLLENTLKVKETGHKTEEVKIDQKKVKSHLMEVISKAIGDGNERKAKALIVGLPLAVIAGMVIRKNM
jgi:hypothetical protein